MTYQPKIHRLTSKAKEVSTQAPDEAEGTKTSVDTGPTRISLVKRWRGSGKKNKKSLEIVDCMSLLLSSGK